MFQLKVFQERRSLGRLATGNTLGLLRANTVRPLPGGAARLQSDYCTRCAPLTPRLRDLSLDKPKPRPGHLSRVIRRGRGNGSLFRGSRNSVYDGSDPRRILFYYPYLPVSSLDFENALGQAFCGNLTIFFFYLDADGFAA